LKIWNWVRDENNREAIKFIGVAVVAIPTTIFGFIAWLGGHEEPASKKPDTSNIQAFKVISQSGAQRIENQLRQCLDGNVIECEGLKYKNEEAHLRCVNDIREFDAVKKSLAHNKCAYMKGTALQIMALAKHISSDCTNFNSPSCVEARQDAKYHIDERLRSLALYLDKYN